MINAKHVVVNAFRSERVIITVEVDGRRCKIFQVFFGRDHSLFVNFPYFRHRIGLLAATTVPGNGQSTFHVDLAKSGKVASHLVKYSHHPDGRAHFSQDGKVRTEIKRQSMRLDDQSGHMFSAIIQGPAAFDEAHPVKDTGTSPKRTVLTFTFQIAPQAIKIIGRWFNSPVQLFGDNNLPLRVGPNVSMMRPDGHQQIGYLVASPYDNAQHILFLTCESVPSLSEEPELLIFYGGFDPPEVMNDTTKEAGFLGFSYPAHDAENLKQTRGTIDFVKP